MFLSHPVFVFCRKQLAFMCSVTEYQYCFCSTKRLISIAVAQGGVLAEDESDSEVVYNDADVMRKNNFLASCRELRDKVAAVEAIQIDILITLLTSADITSEV